MTDYGVLLNTGQRDGHGAKNILSRVFSRPAALGTWPSYRLSLIRLSIGFRITYTPLV